MRIYQRSQLIVLPVIFLSLLGCSSEQPSTPLADPVLTEATEIFLDSDQYYLQPKDVASQEAEASNTNEAVLSSEAESTESAKKPKAKAKPKPKPVNIEYILTRSKEISVGLTSTSPNARIQNDSTSFTPASITKVITTASALRSLGAEFQFKTLVAFDVNSGGQASSLVISADGDPTAGVTAQPAGAPARMKEIAAALKARGIREVSGEITLVAADARLDVATFAAGVPNEDVRECYGSLVSSFNFRSNCALVRVDSKNGFRWDNPEAARFISTKVETEASERTRLALEPMLSPGRQLEGYTLRGTYVASKPRVMQFRLPIGNASAWYAQGLLAALREGGIALSKVSVKLAETPIERSQALAELSRRRSSLVTIESVPLSVLVEATNKPSDNFFADALFKAVGLRLGSPEAGVVANSREQLRIAISGWLREDGHAEWADELKFDEGAGLSNDNRATPRAMLAVLRRLTRESLFPVLWNSLPIAGVDGTLAGRMKSSLTSGKVRGKTGTLTGSYQLVGYIPHERDGRTDYVPFVILTSTKARNRDLVHRFQDAVVVKMAEELRAQK